MARLVALAALLAAMPAAAQTPLSGLVLEAGTDEPLPGASVGAGNSRAVTNAHGFFALTAADADTLTVRYVGFEPFRARVADLRAEARGVTVRLVPAAVALGSAEVTGRAATQAIMGSHVIPVEVAERLPAALGEVDVVRVQQLLPGVRGGTEGTAGLYVRGGSPDQTLTLLDGATVYNAAHLFGFFSTFNPAAVKRVELIKGSLPARFGGRLASVLDVQMREGDAGHVSGEAAVGLLASHVAVEGPLGRRATFAVSARRTYVDAILRPFQPDSSAAGYAFWDVNAKAAWNASPRDRLLLGVYTGRDAFTGRYQSRLSRSSDRLAWGNATATARWTRRLGARAFTETTLLASTYGLGVRSTFAEEGGGAEYRSDYRSGLLDVGGAARLEVAGRRISTTRVGVELTRHGYRPGATVTRATGEPATVGALDPRQTTEGAAYVELEGRPVAALLVNAGVRAMGLATGGQAFGSAEPRVAARLTVTPRLSASASFAAATQYVHLLANSGLGLPTDLWLPATPAVGPERGWQAAVGASAALGRGVDVTVEAYERRMSGLLEYRDGAGFFTTAFANWESQVVRGEGRARGVEVLVQKTAGRTTGWIAYTLARTDRRFDALDGGAWYPYRFDRRHDLSVVVAQRMSSRTDLSATWVYGTGDALTLPVGRAPGFTPDDPGALYTETDVLSSRGQFRMPAVHRLDIAANFHKRVRWGNRTITLGLYNAYSRSNPAYIDVERRGIGVEPLPSTGLPGYSLTTRVRLIQHGLLPVLPSLAYRLRF